MANRHRMIRGQSRHVRETQWIGISPADTTIAAASSSVLIASLSAAALALRPFTIIRIHMGCWFSSDQIAASEVWGGAIAQLVVSEAAATAGVASIPTPYTEQGSDSFMLWHEEHGQIGFGTAVGFQEMGRGVQIDSKAMRKVNNDQQFVLVAETPSISNSLEVITSGRFLIKLH